MIYIKTGNCPICGAPVFSSGSFHIGDEDGNGRWADGVIWNDAKFQSESNPPETFYTCRCKKD